MDGMRMWRFVIRELAHEVRQLRRVAPARGQR